MDDLTTEQQLFLAADAALREVIDQLTPETLKLAVPAEWSSNKTTTMLGLLANHAKDEAWVPDVIAGKTMEQVGDAWTGDLLGTDPIGNYDKLGDLATAAVKKPIADGQIAHLSYGDFPVPTFLEHTSYYRGFQAPLIAKVAGIQFHMSDDLIDMLWESVEPQIDDLRKIHVFGPPVEPPEGADRQDLLLGMTGFYRP
ncbi:MAG TPA: hypothetical protein VHZ81_02395 [Galbitalea sp.]|jgi:hypothetical protein|nr:hypothetical protein [Galbitalea sp.]